MNGEGRKRLLPPDWSESGDEEPAAKFIRLSGNSGSVQYVAHNVTLIN